MEMECPSLSAVTALVAEAATVRHASVPSRPPRPGAGKSPYRRGLRDRALASPRTVAEAATDVVKRVLNHIRGNEWRIA